MRSCFPNLESHAAKRIRAFVINLNVCPLSKGLHRNIRGLVGPTESAALGQSTGLFSVVRAGLILGYIMNNARLQVQHKTRVLFQPDHVRVMEMLTVISKTTITVDCKARWYA